MYSKTIKLFIFLLSFNIAFISPSYSQSDLPNIDSYQEEWAGILYQFYATKPDKYPKANDLAKLIISYKDNKNDKEKAVKIINQMQPLINELEIYNKMSRLLRNNPSGFPTHTVNFHKFLQEVTEYKDF
ncbi:MAG: hypothetical protein COV35_08925 [Alphaproteobacteria bacterium CG11_big_fil_rev_8_21_14_0_20_39_49]|nr:MAG: hypothetical protein COV35_08925 [Alphaproteobacteria bacterium CG11_big_fil_rev_8_21_14_0_20_39_49]